MTVFALEHGLHDLDAAGCKHRRAAVFDRQVKRFVQLLADRGRRCGIFAVDADVCHLKAERGRSCLLAKRGDLLKITGCNVRLRADPAAADRVDERCGDELADVLRVDAAGRDEFDPAEGTRERLHGRKSAIHACWEELYDVQSQLHGCHDFRRRHAAGRHGNAVFHAPADDFFIKAGGNDELRAALDGLAALVERDDRARADEHIGAAFRDRLDRIRRSRRAERDFHHVHAAGKQSLCRRDRVLCIVQHHDRHNSRCGQPF